MFRQFTLVIGFIVGLGILGGQVSGQSPSSIAIQNVTVIPMDRERVLADHTVVVQNGQIVQLGPAASVKIPAGASRVDGRGKFLMPALSDMHAHIPPQFPFQEISDEKLERHFIYFIANGVTTVRSTHGQPRTLVTRERIASGRLRGPTLFVTAPIFSGNPRFGSDPLGVEEVTRRVIEAKAAGFDYVKIHRLVPPDAFDAIVETAKKVGLKIAGHVPEGIALERALKAPFWSIEHLSGFVAALTPPGSPDQLNLGINLVDLVDESRIPAVVEATKRAGTWVVPTESLSENWFGPEDPEVMAKRPEFKYVDPSLAGDVDYWISRQKERAVIYPEGNAPKFIALRRKLIKALHDGGVGIVLGSETPIDWSVPGFSAHRELGLLVASGLTPYQALATATRNAAVFLDILDRTGTVERGKHTDLLLLDANPLQDIANSSRIAGVVIRGHWLPRADLDRALNGGPLPKF